MQTLGLSDSTPRSESRLKSLFWPSIQTGADVDYLAVQGFWVCTIVGMLSLLSQVMIGHAITGLVVFLLFYLGGVGVREHNPFAAAIMLAYYLIEFLSSIVFVFANSPGIGVVKIIIIALLLSNLRATWIAAGWKPDSEEAALPPRFSETFLDKFVDAWPAWIWPKVKVLYYIFSFRVPRYDGRRPHRPVHSARPFLTAEPASHSHFPMQNVLKIRLRMSSVVVAPVMASSGRSEL